MDKLVKESCRIVNNTKFKIPNTALLKCIAGTLEKKGIEKNFACTILIVSEKEIQNLNKKYRDKNTATDVLSFPEQENGYSGEIIISPAFIKKHKTQESFKWELCHAAVHGTLHLLGIHHNSEQDHKKIHKLETQIINKALQDNKK